MQNFDYEFETIYTDFSEHLRTGMQPAVVFSRDPNLAERRQQARDQGFTVARVAAQGKWWVAHTPINKADETKWSFYNSEEKVVVPIYAYNTPGRSPAAIWPTALQMGITAMDSFRETTNDHIEKLMLFVGDNVFDKGEQANQLQCLLGIAVRIRR